MSTPEASATNPISSLPIASPLPRRIGVIGGLGVMVGVIIGSGIFRTPASIAGQLDSPSLILALWALGGLLAMLGAFTYAEMGTMFPQSGGVYVFIREAFGRPAAFVFGWTYMLITKPSAAAGIAVLVGETLNRLLGVQWDIRVTTSVILVIFTAINTVGVREGAGVAVVLTALKLGALATIVALGVLITKADPVSPVTQALAPVPLWSALVVVMSAILWTYDGWSDVGAIAGEVRDPGRNLPRIYLLGTAMVTGLYLAVNAVYMHVLPLDQMRAMPTVAPEVLQRLVGPIGATAVAVAIIISAVGSTHSSIMTGARVTFQQSRDGLLFRPLGAIHPKFQTPHVALLVQMLLSITATWWLEGFDKLASSFVFTMWIFYGLAGVALFVFRVKRPDAPRPFRCPGYPIVPAIFVLAALSMTVLEIRRDPAQSMIWIGILAAGFPVYLVWSRFTKAPAFESPSGQ
jgi:amino acid transporter